MDIRTKYTSIITKDSAVSVYDIANNKCKLIHDKLYDYALRAFIKSLDMDYDEFISNHIIVETQDADYLKPSTISVQQRIKPFARYSLRLDLFWPDYKYTNSGIEPIMVDRTDDYGEYEIINIDFVREFGTLYNRYTGITYDIPLKNINKDTKVADEFSLCKTFGELIKQRHGRK